MKITLCINIDNSLVVIFCFFCFNSMNMNFSSVERKTARHTVSSRAVLASLRMTLTRVNVPRDPK